MSDINKRACEVTLIEKLRSIDKDYRTSIAIQWSASGRETGHRFIPIGYMMHEAADALEASDARYQARMRELEELLRCSHFGFPLITGLNMIRLILKYKFKK